MLSACFWVVLCCLTTSALHASGPVRTTPGLAFSSSVEDGSPLQFTFDRGKKKKKKKKRRKGSPHILGAGVVLGGATGLGGRVVLKPGIVGAAFDMSMDRVRTDDGTRVWTSVMRMDGRLYGRGLLDQLVHPYLLAGVVLQRGKFEEETASTAWSGDIGLGAELKFGRIGVNGEVGMLVPVKSAINFKPGFDFYGGVAVMWWLF